MSILNMECPICTEVFINSDSIYGTSCGHIFHNLCLTEWNKRSSTCPKCCAAYPTNYKLYLSFDENESKYPAIVADLDLKLAFSNEKNEQLAKSIKEMELYCKQLQEQIITIENEKQRLEKRLQENSYSNEKFSQLQKQYTEMQKLNENLKNQISKLSFENQDMINKLNIKSLEMTSPNYIRHEMTDTLERKLEYIYGELEKEIAANSKLTIENFKLQSFIEHLQSIENNRTNTKQKENKNSTFSTDNVQQCENSANIQKHSKENNNNNIISKIIIENIPSSLVSDTPFNTLANIAYILEISISPEDLNSIEFIDNNDKLFSFDLLADFINLQLINEFVIRQYIYDCSGVSIRKYTEDVEFHSLLAYAKLKLKNNGYDHIFCKDNKIFVKKHRKHPKLIRILNRTQVDNLTNKNNSSHFQQNLENFDTKKDTK